MKVRAYRPHFFICIYQTGNTINAPRFFSLVRNIFVTGEKSKKSKVFSP